MRSAHVLFLAPLLGLVQCGPITVPASLDTYNVCTSDKSCEGYCPKHSLLCEAKGTRPTCLETGWDIKKGTRSSAKACLAASQPNLVLIVDVPDGSQYAPTQTFVLTSQSISASEAAYETMQASCFPAGNPPCCRANRQANAGCVPLPQLAGVGLRSTQDFCNNGSPALGGFYPVTSTLASEIQVTLPGLTAGLVESVPAQLSLSPQWKVGSTFPAPPALLGLPIPVMQGSIVSSFQSVDGLSTPPLGPFQAAPPGPVLKQGPAVGWVNFAFPSGVLPSQLTYSQAVEVLPPYESIPPVLDPTFLGQPWCPTPPLAAAPTPTRTTVCVDLPPGEKPDGWTVYFQEALNQRLVSSVVGVGVPVDPLSPTKTLVCKGLSARAQGANVYSFLADLTTPSTEPVVPHLVIAPPPGRVQPTLIDRYQGFPEHFLNVPEPAKLHGRVLFGGANISAELHFKSTSIYGQVGTGCSRNRPAPSLYYEALVATDLKHVGEYSVLLPEGEYDITINPDSASGAPQTKASFALPVDAKSCPAPAEGIQHDLQVPNALAVSGTVALPGTMGALRDATVSLTPSIPTLNPTTTSVVSVSPIDLPPSFQTITDANGQFTFKPPDAIVGAGTYDVTVRPLDGTNLPWVVYQTVPIAAAHAGGTGSGASSGDLGTFTIPAPAPLTLTIHDPQDQAVPGAVVRAYAFPPCQTSPCYAPAHQIGLSITDETGTFQMFLAPVPFVTPTTTPAPRTK